MDLPDWVERIDPCEAGCPSRELLDMVGDRWSLLILLMIGRGARHNGALKRQVGAISQKMLTQTLRALEANGLVTRHDFATVPPHVEYALTPLGVSLGHALGAMFEWIEVHHGDVLQARDRYAARMAAAA